MNSSCWSRKWAFVACCVLALVALASGASIAGIYRSSFALLVGINEYPNLSLSNQLAYSVNDVQSLREMLIRSYGFPSANIKVLTNAEATLAGIADALSEYADSDRIKKDDRVLIYFSGHGQTVKTSTGGDMGFLLPYDARVKLSAMENAGPFMKTCLPMSRVWEYLQPCPAKHVLILADVCYSGLLAQPRTSEDYTPQAVELLARTPARQVITAGGKGQKSIEKAEWGHGAFTYKLLEKLDARAGQAGKIFTAQELFVDVQRGVGNITGGKQTPQLYAKDTEGEFLFVPEGGSESAYDPPSVPEPEPAVIPIPPAIADPPKTVRPPVVTQEESKEQAVVDFLANYVPSGTKKWDTAVNPKDGAEMMWVPAGEFIMGSDDIFDEQKPQRKVYLDGYWMYKYEVTVAQYGQFCSESSRKMPNVPDWGWNDNHPVVNVSWQDAAEYAVWAGASLPTEAQWEKAARGTDGRTYPWGHSWDAYRLQCSKSIFGDAGKTATVGSFASGASPYGCMDMAGNVAEWCADWYAEDYYKSAPARNPMGSSSGSARVLRGGSWYYFIDYDFQCANRYLYSPVYRFSSDGFRCARTP